jgi:hypothetical protein
VITKDFITLLEASSRQEKAKEKGLTHIAFKNYKDKQENIWKWEDEKNDFIKTGEKETKKPTGKKPTGITPKKPAEKEKTPKKPKEEPQELSSREAKDLYKLNAVNIVTDLFAPTLFRNEDHFAEVYGATVAKPIPSADFNVDGDVRDILDMKGNSQDRIEQAEKSLNKYGRDFESMSDWLEKAEDISPPVIIKDKNGVMKIVYGNPTLITAAAVGKIHNIPIKVIDYKEAFKKGIPSEGMEIPEFKGIPDVKKVITLLKGQDEKFGQEPGSAEALLNKRFEENKAKLFFGDGSPDFEAIHSVFKKTKPPKFFESNTIEEMFTDIPDDLKEWINDSGKQFADHAAAIKALKQIDIDYGIEDDDVWNLYTKEKKKLAKTWSEFTKKLESIEKKYPKKREDSKLTDYLPDELKPEHPIPSWAGPRQRVLDIKEMADKYRGLPDTRFSEVTGIELPENPKVLGAGTQGVAFDIGEDRVLKITWDKAEAETTAHLMDKNIEGLQKVSHVLKGSGGNLFYLVGEKLDFDPERSLDLSSRAKGDFKNTQQLFQDINSGWVKLDEVEQPDLKYLLKTLYKVGKAGIQWGDLHEGNLMWRGDQPVIIDLGYSSGGETEKIKTFEQDTLTLGELPWI